MGAEIARKIADVKMTRVFLQPLQGLPQLSRLMCEVSGRVRRIALERRVKLHVYKRPMCERDSALALMIAARSVPIR